MAGVEIPKALRELLAERSELEAPTVALAGAVGKVLGDNEMPFFPAYTDHGAEHVDRVLAAAVALVPEAAWEQLHPPDVAALVVAAMLHDLAMHVREQGFLELVGDQTVFEPQQWFGEDHDDREGDLPWPQLWRDFQREARHFGTSQLESLLGWDADGCPAVAYQETLDPSKWTTADRLLVGEFLRRHHARLAHEIAQFGFPGADPKTFPVLSETMPTLAKAAGALARSHGERLRVMLDYARFLEPGNKRPEGVLLVYLMGLLRVADYLQIDADRAPPLLLRLKRPQSRLSVEEWNKHRAISSIAWESEDPYAISITVSPDHGLRTHLALADLFEDMQREMDVSTAVIDQVFGAGDLSDLGLTRRRIVTNLDQPSLHQQLDYIPRRAPLRSDPDLFRLVIRDLYGNQPAVAGRELIQNAVDAVRVRRAHEARSSAAISPEEFGDLKADVVVTLEEGDDGQCLLRIADRGIGMTPDLLIDYFLQAGASFGPSSADLTDGGEAPMKAGRFGVGAFAAFLLGPEMRVRTRHVKEERGVSFRARIDEDLVRLEWDDLPIGTEIEIPFDAGTIPSRRWREKDPHEVLVELLQTISGCYRLSDPKTLFVHRWKSGEEETEQSFFGPGEVPPPGGRLPDRWRRLRNHGMDAVLWRIPPREVYGEDEFYFPRGGLLAHNGIVIQDLSDYLKRELGAYVWSDDRLSPSLRRPALAVFDKQHALRVTLHRYSLVDRILPFEDKLLDSIATDVVAHALAAPMEVHPLLAAPSISPIFSLNSWMPALPALLDSYLDEPLLVLWRDGGSVPSWNEDSSPDSDAFVAARASLSWRKFGFRAYADFEPHGEEAQEELEEWGFGLQTIPEEADLLAERMGADRPLTALVRGSDDYIFGVGRGPDAPERNKAGEKLLAAAEELRDKEQIQWVALTLFDGFSGRGPAHERLAAKWCRVFGGGLVRSGQEREEAVERTLAEHPSLAPLVNKWKRSLPLG